MSLNYMPFLCDKVWIKPNWIIFSLYCLRFVEKFIIDKNILSLVKQGVSCVKLVASIKNFINEIEYKSFEVE